MQCKCSSEAQALPFPGLQINWVINWVRVSEGVSTRFFSIGYLSNRGRHRNEMRHKGSLGDDVRTSNTRDTTLDDEKYNVHNIADWPTDRPNTAT